MRKWRVNLSGAPDGPDGPDGSGAAWLAVDAREAVSYLAMGYTVRLGQVPGEDASGRVDNGQGRGVTTTGPLAGAVAASPGAPGRGR